MWKYLETTGRAIRENIKCYLPVTQSRMQNTDFSYVAEKLADCQSAYASAISTFIVIRAILYKLSSQFLLSQKQIKGSLCSQLYVYIFFERYTRNVIHNRKFDFEKNINEKQIVDCYLAKKISLQYRNNGIQNIKLIQNFINNFLKEISDES